MHKIHTGVTWQQNWPRAKNNVLSVNSVLNIREQNPEMSAAYMWVFTV